MTHAINKFFKKQLVRAAYLCAGLLVASTVQAATISLANAPLATSTTSTVLPNLMYVLDNSGSMDRNYMPDYMQAGFGVPEYDICKVSGGTFTTDCNLGDPAFMSNDFNRIYYNPAITYAPAVNSDGTSKASMTFSNTSGWTAVRNDPYLSGQGTTSLVPNAGNSQGYRDTVWCNTNSTTTADLSNPAVCNKNSQYIYPTNTFQHAKTLRTYPFYYTINPTEYCANKDLTSCQAAEDATHIYPARVRWCNSTTLTTCQAKFFDDGPDGDDDYNHAKWLGITTTYSGSIKILATNANSPTASPTALLVNDIQVAGVSIIAAPGSSLSITDNAVASQRNSLAADIANAINSHTSAPDYTAVSAGDVVTLTTAGVSAATIEVFSTTAPTSGGVLVPAEGQFRITATRWNHEISSIRVGGVEILDQTIKAWGGNGNSRRNFATAIVNRINSHVSSPDYTATRNNNGRPTISIRAVSGGAGSNGTIAITKTWGISYGNKFGMANGGSLPGQPYQIPVQIANFTGGSPTVASFERFNIEPGTTSYAKAETRTDCLGLATCTFEEEMTNFANWYSYYRTRILMMKSSTSIAFKDIDDSFRLGFTTLTNQNSNYLAISKFTNAHKGSWYTKLFGIDPSNSTPLRSALANVGRMYAGKNPMGSDDPVQYSCQQNFTLLTTDGYWNSDSASDVKNVLGTGSVGNVDNIASERPLGFYEGAVGTSATLADAAKYYYETDLRQPAFNNCTATPIGGNPGKDVCNNNVFVSGTDNNAKQHMTTFTLGLGVNGSLDFDPEYKTQTSGDYFDIKDGSKDWPKPVQNRTTTVDDLWHAAVNGRGTYFSAQDPTQLSESLSGALTAIESKKGAGAAAATSTLNPVSGDNFAYVASYETVKWTGNLEARSIDLETGEVGVSADWCLQDVGADSCAGENSSIVTELVGGVAKTFCKTTGSSALNCSSPGILDASNNCRVELATYCEGTMPARVTATTDTRTIYINDGGDFLSFDYTNLVTIGQNANFEPGFLDDNFTQWSSLTETQKTNVTAERLVKYLRGRTGFEDRAANTEDNKLFRQRDAVIGDALDSTPTFNGVPKAAYTDPGYGSATTVGSFANDQANRGGTVYFGTNDGMLHAINADNGQERWAFIPTQVIPNMWRLADKNYGANHRNYVNGDMEINDICIADCTASSAIWKTILVGGLNGGGKGYYAIDITDPDVPVMLWEFDDTVDADVGYSYGSPVITKLANGKWVVLVTSGYNNVDGSNPGKGFLYVLDALTGQILLDPDTTLPFKYATGVGDVTTPSGLADMSGFITDAQKNNSVLNIYSGDLFGNVWRFDINSPQTVGNATTRANPFKLAKVQGPGFVDQPITVQLELTEVDNKRLVIIGTGKYLETSDLSNTATQSLYAITDESYDDTNNSATTLVTRGSGDMVEQAISNTGNTRTVTNNEVDYSSKRGWYIDLPDTGERQNVAAQLAFGTLIVPTIVPSNTECSPGGYGWINFLNFRTGAIIAGSTIGAKTNAPIVGVNVLYINGKPTVSIVTADNPTPEPPPIEPPFAGGLASGFKEHRVIWRELIEEQK